MANKIVNLNTNASALMGTHSKVRMRVVDGVVQILPTDRVSPKNLPKGEVLIDLRAKSGGKTLRFSLDAEVAGDMTAFTCHALKHHWIALVAGEQVKAAPGVAAPAGGSVAAK